MHGNDWQAIYDKYRPLVRSVQHRADLAYLIATVGGELTVGHSYLEGAGDVPDTAHDRSGCSAPTTRWRTAAIASSASTPRAAGIRILQAPLSAPGLKVAEGDYLLDVNGRALAAPANLYSSFEGTAGKLTTIRVNSTPTLQGLVARSPSCRSPTMKRLRTQAWIDDNRRLVDKLSGGRLAYVWLPNTAGDGYTAFNRYFFAQQDKQGVIIDERYNQGGCGCGLHHSSS